MGRKSNKSRNKINQPPSEPVFHPKAGPAQIFTRELVGADTGHAKRYRNINASPLLLALHRGQLDGGNKITAADRFSCGEIFAKQWRLAFSTGGRDSTNPGIGGGVGGFTEARQDAGRAVQRYRARMAAANYAIIEAFCGDEFSMVESLRRASVEVHPVGTAYRVREALDDLVGAITGAREGRVEATKPVDNAR